MPSLRGQWRLALIHFRSSEAIWDDQMMGLMANAEREPITAVWGWNPQSPTAAFLVLLQD